MRLLSHEAEAEAMSTQRQVRDDKEEITKLIRNYRAWVRKDTIKVDSYQDRLVIDDWHGEWVWRVAFYGYRSDRMVDALVSPYFGIVVVFSNNKVFFNLSMDDVLDVAKALGLLYLPATRGGKHGFGCWSFTYAGFVGYRCVDDDDENHSLFIIGTGNAVYTAHVHRKDRKARATLFRLRGATAEVVRTIFFTV